MHVSPADTPLFGITLEYQNQTYNDSLFPPVMKLFKKAYDSGFEIASSEKNAIAGTANFEFG
jgi:hypothetical protein